MDKLSNHPGARLRRTISGICVLLAAYAGSASAINLQQAYQAALKQDPTFRMNFFENEAGKENRKIGRAALSLAWAIPWR